MKLSIFVLHGADDGIFRDTHRFYTLEIRYEQKSNVFFTNRNLETTKSAKLPVLIRSLSRLFQLQRLLCEKNTLDEIERNEIRLPKFH